MSTSDEDFCIGQHFDTFNVIMMIHLITQCCDFNNLKVLDVGNLLHTIITDGSQKKMCRVFFVRAFIVPRFIYFNRCEVFFQIIHFPFVFCFFCLHFFGAKMERLIFFDFICTKKSIDCNRSKEKWEECYDLLSSLSSSLKIYDSNSENFALLKIVMKFICFPSCQCIVEFFPPSFR